MWFPLFLLFVSFPVLAQDTPRQSLEERVRWQTIDDLDGRFGLSVPGPLDHRTDTLATAVGKQLYHTFFYKAPEEENPENLIYVLSYVDYPPGALPADSTGLIEEFLLTTEESAAEALGGEVVYATPRTVLGFPGRLWRINYRDGEASARTLAFLADRRYYELKTFSLNGRGLGDATDRFFESFRYLGGDRAN
jgi:hypothetical protein